MAIRLVRPGGGLGSFHDFCNEGKWRPRPKTLIAIQQIRAFLSFMAAEIPAFCFEDCGTISLETYFNIGVL